MAKETMLAVSQGGAAGPGNSAACTGRSPTPAPRCRRQGQQLIEAAVKEAQKRADILYGVARADGEKRKAAIQRECQEEQEQLRALARSRQGQVARAAERIVLGHPRRR